MNERISKPIVEEELDSELLGIPSIIQPAQIPLTSRTFCADLSILMNTLASMLVEASCQFAGIEEDAKKRPRLTA